MYRCRMDDGPLKLSVDNIYLDFFGLTKVQSANTVVDGFKTHTAANHYGAGGSTQVQVKKNEDLKIGIKETFRFE